MKKKFIFFGLGNPEKKYFSTFHNAGWQVLDQIAEKNNLENTWKENKKTACQEIKFKKDPFEIILAKSLNFMNLSGISLKKILLFYRIPLANIVLVHDDADLSLGNLRLSYASGSGGHKGIESIFLQTGEKNFYRLRIGIGRPEEKQSLKNFVLKKIPSNQKNLWKNTLEKTEEALFSFCQNGPEKTASLFNKKDF